MDFKVIGGTVFTLKPLPYSLLWMGQLIVIKECSHEALLCQGNGYSRGIAGDPASAPLLGHVGGGARATGGIEDQIAGIGTHEKATLDNSWMCLDNKNFLPPYRTAKLRPKIRKR